MKKLLVLAAAIFLSTAAFSQAQFSIGVKAGPNFSRIDTESSVMSNYKSRAGFHGGAFALLKFAKFGIQPEILFSQQGSKFTFNSQDLESNYSYINIPVIVKLYTIGGINLQVGPQFGFLASAQEDKVDALGNVQTSQDVKDEIKKSDFGAALGVGWDLPFGLSIDGRYNLGLSDINDASGNERKNQVWQVSLGYKLFKFGK
jgi:hypothetical protein